MDRRDRMSVKTVAHGHHVEPFFEDAVEIVEFVSPDEQLFVGQTDSLDDFPRDENGVEKIAGLDVQHAIAGIPKGMADSIKRAETDPKPKTQSVWIFWVYDQGTRDGARHTPGE